MHELDPWVVSELLDAVHGQAVVLSPGYGADDDDGLPPARRLAERLGVPVTGPTGSIRTGPAGLFADGPGGAWVICSPEGEQRRMARRQPPPSWQDVLPEDREGIIPIPAGIWIPPEGHAPRSAGPLHELESGDHPLVVVGAPGGTPPHEQQIVDALRALPERMRSTALLAGWGHRSLPNVSSIASTLETSVRVVHGLPLTSGFAELAIDGDRRWRSFGIETVVGPDGRSSEQRWVRPPGLAEVSGSTYVLVEGWHVDVLPGGLLVRPSGQDAATDGLRPRIEAGPDSMPEVVLTTGPRGELGDDVTRALAELLERWEGPGHVRLRPADTAARLGLARTFAGRFVELGRSRPEDESAAQRGTVTVTSDGRIVATEPAVAAETTGRLGHDVDGQHEHAVSPPPPPAPRRAAGAVRRAPVLDTVRTAFERFGGTPGTPRRSSRHSGGEDERARRGGVPVPSAEVEPNTPMPIAPTPIGHDPMYGIGSRREEPHEGDIGTEFDADIGVQSGSDAPDAGREPTERPKAPPPRADLATEPSSRMGRRSDAPDSGIGAVPRSGADLPTPPPAAAAAAPAAEPRAVKRMHLPSGAADSSAGPLGAEWSTVPETVIPAASPAQRGAARPESRYGSASSGGAGVGAGTAAISDAVAGGEPAAAPEVARRPSSVVADAEDESAPGASAILAPSAERRLEPHPEIEAGTRSTPEQRRDVRAALGTRYDVATRAVSRALAERPGIHVGDSDPASLLTQLAVVHLFAERPNETYDAAFATVLAEGLQLMPTVRRVVVRGIPKDSELDDDEVLRVRAPILTAPTDGELTGDSEALIWTTSGRRLDALFDPSGIDGEVVLTAHSAYEVVGREPGPVPRVLLAECGSSREKALGRLREVARRRDALTERTDSDRWCGPVMMRA